MATTIAAMKSKMGEIPYYVMTMPVQDLVKLVHIPSKKEWEEISVEEKFQRALKDGPRLNAIVEYLERDKHRFFGSVIVASPSWSEKNFEPLDKIITDLPNAYDDEAAKIGFYSFKGDKRLFVLDGQHRVRALELAIKGKPGKGSNPELCKDKITVILLAHKLEISRKIFTKVNRNAKPTTTGETLITDDDDIIAVLSREIADKIITARLVMITGNNITENNLEFTTLSTIAEGTFSLLKGKFPFKNSDRKQLPAKDLQDKYRKDAFAKWNFLLDNFAVWKEALKDKTEKYDYIRQDLRKNYLCMRPMPQRVIIDAFSYVTNLGTPMSEKDAVMKLNEIPWEFKAKLWDRLLFSGGKIQAKNQKLATDILIYILLGAERYGEAEEKKLQKRYKDIFPDEEKRKIKLSQVIELASLKTPAK